MTGFYNWDRDFKEGWILGLGSFQGLRVLDKSRALYRLYTSLNRVLQGSFHQGVMHGSYKAFCWHLLTGSEFGVWGLGFYAVRFLEFRDL